MSQFQPRSAFARALNRVISDGRFTVAEIAEAGGISPRKVGYVQTGEQDISMEHAEKVSRYLCENGETRPAEQLFCTRYAVVERVAGTADGCVKHELVRIVRGMADADAAMDARDADRLDAGIALIRSALADLEAERNLLP